jgi:hypothetical protein
MFADKDHGEPWRPARLGREFGGAVGDALAKRGCERLSVNPPRRHAP